MNMKRMLALLLALTMVFALCACGGNDAAEDKPQADAPAQDAPAKEETEAPTEEETEAPTQAPGITYTVTVADEGGNAVAGVMIQICQGEMCLMPSTTDANGVATLIAPEEGNWEAKVLTMPEGYALAEEAEYFAFDSSNNLTITLKAVA